MSYVLWELARFGVLVMMLFGGNMIPPFMTRLIYVFINIYIATVIGLYLFYDSTSTPFTTIYISTVLSFHHLHDSS